MAEGKVYDIPASRFDWFRDQLEKLGRKAKKLNGEKLSCVAVGFHKEEREDSIWHGEKIMEVFVACPEPKLEGWEFVARIDHAHEVGNIVRSTGLRELPENYRIAPPSCDHCHHRRQRRDTFIVYNELEGYRQVGSSCLKDFLGHGDADRIAKLAELLASIHGFMNSAQEGEGLVNRLSIITEDYLGYVADEVLHYGFISKATAYRDGSESTAERALISQNRRIKVSQEAKDLARQALDWASSLDENGEELNDYLHNAWVVANSPMIETRSMGIAASIVGVYKRSLEPKVDKSLSQFQGTRGDKIEVLVMVDEVRVLDSGSHLHRLRDREGNLYTWFASGVGLRDRAGKPVRITGTVKDHNTFRGVNSTILTRVKALA